jgi:predicted DNA-binding transcriptional regulator AlpA
MRTRTQVTTPAPDQTRKTGDTSPRAAAPDSARVFLLRPRECARVLGISTTSLWRWSRDPAMDFPAAIRLGKNSVAFDEFEVRAWLATRRAR